MTGNSEVQVGRSHHIIPMSSVHSVDLNFEICQASMACTMKRLLPMQWRKTYQQSRQHICREGKLQAPPVHGAHDVLIGVEMVQM